MGAKNKVIAGDYKGQSVFKVMFSNVLTIGVGLDNQGRGLYKTNVKNYEIVDEKTSKSASSAILRAGVGAVLLGPIGLAAALSAKSKGVHLVAIEFITGEKSLIEIDDKLYKILVSSLF